MKIATYPTCADGLSAVDYIIECGYTSADVSADEILDDLDMRACVLDYATERGLSVGFHAPFRGVNIISPDRELRDLSLEKIKRAIDLAAEYGIPVVTFHPGKPTEEDASSELAWKDLFSAVEEIAVYAKEKRVRVGLENMEKRKFEIVCTIEDLNRFAYIAENNEYFGVTLDFVHLSTHGIFEPDLSELKLPVYDVHISQNANGKTHQPLTVEGGTVHLDAIARSLVEYGYDGFVVLEVNGDHKGSLEVMRAAVEKYEKRDDK